MWMCECAVMVAADGNTYRKTSRKAGLTASDPLEGFGFQPVMELCRGMEPYEATIGLSRLLHSVFTCVPRWAMALDPAQASTDEGSDGSTKLVENPERMDLLSLIFRSLDDREEKILTEDRSDVDVRGRKTTRPENKSSSQDVRRSGRRVTTDDLTVVDDDDERTLNVISLDQLAWHDSADDCWLAIYDYVYDCTEFVGRHPGGEDVLLEYAGRDATLAFIGSGHSSETRKILEKYLIGELPACERIFRIVDGVKIVQK